MPDAPDDAAGVRCMVIVDIRDLAVPSTITVPIGAFFQMPSFEGHRDNKRRAAKAYHLHVFQPDHVRCEAGIITTDGKLPHDLLNVIGANPKGVVRFTGNTRAHCWEFGLTDRVPSHVILDVYPCRDEAHVQELGTHFDSPAAAWTRHDHDYRAMGLAFKEEWRPRSRAGKNGAFGGAADRRTPTCMASTTPRRRFTQLISCRDGAAKSRSSTSCATCLWPSPSRRSSSQPGSASWPPCCCCYVTKTASKSRHGGARRSRMKAPRTAMALMACSPLSK